MFHEVIGCSEVNWVYLTLDRDKWRILVNKAMNLLFEIKAIISQYNRISG